ncbi:uncharacterized protein UBRO_06669 [Ustilago bromivora]|uniref:Peptidase S54 rhomboid domain-containing protein n=1 Tax=Ustilago bromivora TaxID=307758 RepID=A0A1K0H746_9BASI|nr:uncharacterized protein UBRO_06669 [Ustilago bromivora]SYW73838.1 uncharacterized protein UBRO2_00113 [Ustilago bromivora]
MVAGFAHAPLTKGILITLTITSILVSLFQLKPFIHLQIHPHLTVHHQYYRLITQHFAFTNSSELFLGLLLFYDAGVKVERTFGTYKYASFLVVTTTLYTAVQVILFGLSSFLLAQYTKSPWSPGVAEGLGEKHWFISGRTPAGPWALLFSILHQHSSIVPHLWSISISDSLMLTDKDITTYSLALLVAFSHPSSSLFASLLATVISALYRTGSGPFCRLKQYRIPLRLYRILSLLLTPWIGQTRLPQRSWRVEPPARRTREAREARLAQHNAALVNLNRGGAGAVPRLASFLRPRRETQPPAVLPTQGGRGQVAREGEVRGGVDGRRGWNDIPPDTRAELQSFPRTDVLRAMQGSDGDPQAALNALRATSLSSVPDP